MRVTPEDRKPQEVKTAAFLEVLEMPYLFFSSFPC